MISTHAMGKSSALNIPLTEHQHCGRFAGGGQLTWCHPCGQQCAMQAGVPYPWYHVPIR